MFNVLVGFSLASIVAMGAGFAVAQSGGGAATPGARLISSMADCDALQREWDAYKSQLNVQHEACLAAYRNTNPRTIGTCSKPACQQLHTLLFDRVPAESSTILKDCRAKAAELERQRQIAKQQQAANEATVRRSNEQRRQALLQFAADQRRYNQQLQERDRQERAAILRRNQEIQQRYEEYARNTQARAPAPNEQAARALQSVRESLKNTTDALSGRVSNLFDAVDSTSIDGVDSVRTAAANSAAAFSLYNATQQLDPPQRIEAISQFTDNVGALWNIFSGVGKSRSTNSSDWERFDGQMQVLSNSTTFLFRAHPGVGDIVSGRIEGVQRWSHSVFGYLDSALSSGEIPSDDQITEDFVRDNFPAAAWFNDKVKAVESAKGQLYQFFGR